MDSEPKFWGTSVLVAVLLGAAVFAVLAVAKQWGLY